MSSLSFFISFLFFLSLLVCQDYYSNLGALHETCGEKATKQTRSKKEKKKANNNNGLGNGFSFLHNLRVNSVDLLMFTASVFYSF